MTSTRTMGRDGATLRVGGWDGSSLGAGLMAGAPPLAFKGGVANLYRYVHNDPTDRTDPTGLSDKPDNPVPTDLTIGNPGNAIVLIGPDGPGPKGSHELYYPGTFTGTYGVPAGNIFYFNNPASF